MGTLCSGVCSSLQLTVCGAGRVKLSSTLPAFAASQTKKLLVRSSLTRLGHFIILGKSHNQTLRSLSDTADKWKHLSVVSVECLPYMSQSLCQSYLRCCLRCLWLMETLACSVCGMPTIHFPITVPELSEMLLTVLMVNGNTCLQCLRNAYHTCPNHCPRAI